MRRFSLVVVLSFLVALFPQLPRLACDFRRLEASKGGVGHES
jgi:hypothetical protein